jgi:hypothetical protein
MNESGLLEDKAIEKQGNIVVIRAESLIDVLKDYFPQVTKTPGIKRQLEDVERCIKAWRYARLLDFESKLKLITQAPNIE